MDEILNQFPVEAVLDFGAKGLRFILILAFAALLSRIVARVVGRLPITVQATAYGLWSRRSAPTR